VSVLRQSADTRVQGELVVEAGQTFGKYISEVRKQQGLSQKQLAERIEREEGGSISPQYLNDIEHDRRNPSSDYMIQQFSRVLKVSADYLYYLAGRIPADMRQANMPPNQVERWASAFRRTNPPKRRG
jgi:transcriptional regulator with XRE-family HTH domain